MANALWGATGELQDWFVQWSSLSPGARVDIVAQPVCMGSDGGLACLFPCGTRTRFRGLALPPGVDTFSIFGALVVETGDVPVLDCDDLSLVLSFPPVSADDCKNVTEVCAGMGIATYGFEHLGLKVVVANELRPKLAAAYECLHDSVPVVVGDVCQGETIHQMWQKHGRSTLLFGGFACQPFSRGGVQQGVLDARTQTFRGTLKAGLMLRSPVIMMECVPEASNNSYIRRELELFCRQCRFHCVETQLALEDCWVSRRSRWWVILTAQLLGPVPLSRPPHFPFPLQVKQVLPKYLDLDPEELEQLRLGSEECRQFLRFVPSLPDLFLHASGQAPTALHSWGSQVVGCSCECRLTGFSESLLQQRGIYGVLVPCEGEIDVGHCKVPAVRHIHPTELALLTCVPLPKQWPADLRLAVCGLGQQATPLQSLWVAGHVTYWLEKLKCGSSTLDVWKAMDSLRAQVLESSKKLFGTPSSPRLFCCPSLPVSPVEMTGDGVLPVELDVEPQVPVHQTDDLPPWRLVQHHGDSSAFTIVERSGLHEVQVVTHDAPVSVEQVCQAESALHLMTEHVDVVDCATGKSLAHNELVNGKAVLILRSIRVGENWQYDEPSAAPTQLDLPAEYDFVPPTESEHPMDGSVVDCDDYDAIVVGSLDMVTLTVDEHNRLMEIMDGFGVSLDPLCKLDAAGFLAVVPPSLNSLHVVECLCRREIPSNLRLEILDRQAQLWSDDEIRFHLQQILLQVETVDQGFVDPLLAAEMIRNPRSTLLSQWAASWDGELSSVCAVLWISGHWIPIKCTWSQDVMQVVSWDNTQPQPRELTRFCDALCAAVGVGRFVLRVEHRQFEVQDCCGVCAVRYLDHLIRGKMLPSSYEEVVHLHNVGRSFFVSHLLAKQFVPRPWIWGNGLDAQTKTRLGDLLSAHGVPNAQIETRIHLVTQSLGVSQLVGILAGSSPWRSLKSAANSARPVVQLVLKEELQQQVAKKMEQGSIGKKSKRQTTLKPPTVPVALDPLKLAVDVGTFESAAGSALRQLSVSQIGPVAEGVVVCNMASAGAFLRADQPVNKLALALVIVDASDKDLPSKLQWEQTRVAMRCAANGEPLLALVHIVQLGGVEVKQARGKLATELPAADVTCVKASVYRDQIDCSWPDFCKSPIRYLLAHLLPLRVCDSCGEMAQPECRCWHPTGDDIQDPILDVWRRQWLNLQFKPTSNEDASIFLVNFRFLHSLEEAVLRCSGRGGIYLEPRSVDARNATLDYQVVWVQRADHAEIDRICQCNPLAIGAARVGSRLGVRVRTADASTLGSQLKPGSVYLASGTRIEYEVGPLPYGLDRVALSKMFSAWGWHARPLHPIRALHGAAGAVWLVQSCGDPPSQVVSLKHGDVVISKVGPKQPTSSETPVSVVSSSTTLELCQVKVSENKESGSGVDPWLLKDPWAQAVVSMPHGADQTAEALKQVEARVEQNVLAKLPVQSMHDDAVRILSPPL